jgi:spermidine/putrescine transport system substrate-binding protein
MKALRLRTIGAAIIIVGVCCLTAMLALAQTASKKQELVFLNWSDYIDPDLVRAFEQKFNARVKQVYFESDELKDEMLVETEGKGYDVVLSGASSISSYIKRDWLLPLNTENIPNLKHLDMKLYNAQPQIKGYGAPYLWGTVGIAYRQDLVTDPVTTWMQLYQPAPSLQGKILMIKDSREVVELALKALGFSLNSTDLDHYNAAEKLVLSQKPFVKSYSYVGVTEESSLVSGEAHMAMVYNGDALTLRKYNPHIAYVVPQEGTRLWIDYLVVMKASQNKELALAFINFLHEPENAARLAATLNFATPNSTAEKLLPQEQLKNPVIYPEKSVLDRSEFSTELPARIMKKRNAIFSRLIQ